MKSKVGLRANRVGGRARRYGSVAIIVVALGSLFALYQNAAGTCENPLNCDYLNCMELGGQWCVAPGVPGGGSPDDFLHGCTGDGYNPLTTRFGKMDGCETPLPPDQGGGGGGPYVSSACNKFDELGMNKVKLMLNDAILAAANKLMNNQACRSMLSASKEDLKNYFILEKGQQGFSLAEIEEMIKENPGILDPYRRGDPVTVLALSKHRINDPAVNRSVSQEYNCDLPDNQGGTVTYATAEDAMSMGVEGTISYSPYVFTTQRDCITLTVLHEMGHLARGMTHVLSTSDYDRILSGVCEVPNNCPGATP